MSKKSPKTGTGNPVGRPRIHPIKTPISQTPKPLKLASTVTKPLAAYSDESDNNVDDQDVPGKKSKINPKTNQKFLNNTQSSRNNKYNNIMLIKNEQIVSNSSSLKQLKNQLNHLDSSINSKPLLSIPPPVTHQFSSVTPSSTLHPSAAERQQQNTSTALGVSDRMSKEKQKFFRFSVFNSERKSKIGSNNTKQAMSNLNNNNNSNNNNNNGHKIVNGINDAMSITSSSAYDKYKFVSSSDSENEQSAKIICDSKTNKVKGRLSTAAALMGSLKKSSGGGKTKILQANSVRDAKPKSNKAKEKGKLKLLSAKRHSSDDDSSCCSSDDDETESSSDTSSSSSDSSTSSTGSSSSVNSSSSNDKGMSKNATKPSSQTNKTESINTMNVFACINSRELANQANRPFCWTSMPFSKGQQTESLFKRKSSTFSKSFGTSSTRAENEVWGFAAEAKKTINIFTNSDNESRTQHMSNFSGTESDCQMSLLSLGSSSARVSSRLSRSNRDAVSSRYQFNPHMSLVGGNLRKNNNAKLANDYMFANRRTMTLMRNNTIMNSDDDDGRKQLSPSKMVRKAVNYKKFDNNTLNNKKLIMDTSLNGGFNDRVVKEPSATTTALPGTLESTKHSQPPYNNNTINPSDMGKKLT